MAESRDESEKTIRITLGSAEEDSDDSLRSEVVIGRGIDCDVVVKDAKASRRHCRLIRTDDGFILQDLGSRNGTFVGGVRIETQVALKTSDTFKIGDTVFYLT